MRTTKHEECSEYTWWAVCAWYHIIYLVPGMYILYSKLQASV